MYTVVKKRVVQTFVTLFQNLEHKIYAQKKKNLNLGVKGFLNATIFFPIKMNMRDAESSEETTQFSLDFESMHFQDQRSEKLG